MATDSAMKGLFGLLAPVALWVGAAWAQHPPADLTDYVAQSLCLDESGRPVDRLPIQAACVRRRPQRADDIAVYRKHDWPNRLDEPATVLGYQASDSVLERRGSRTIVVQTFDFGTGGRTFGTFDARQGDGGQVLLSIGDWASFAMTEDGGGGVQWFLGEACQSSVNQSSVNQSPVDADARFLGWLVFRSDVGATEWQSIVAQLNIAATPTACPSRFNAAFTRFRQESIALPFRIVDSPSRVRTSLFPLDVIVSEHYGGHDIRTADHLERFYLANGLGLVRWERWANGNLRQPPDVIESSRMLGATARCPSVARQGPTAPGWLLVDCRTWTTMVRQVSPWRVRDYAWPALNGLGTVD